MSGRNLLIFGNYGASNFGDEAILAGLLKLISSEKWNICVISSKPVFTVKRYEVRSVYPPPFGIRSLFRGGLFKTLKRIRSADLIIFGGGGLFQDKEWGALTMWTFFLRICLFYRKRIILAANSIGPLNRSSSHNTVSKLFRRIPFFSVRDQASQILLRKLGVPEPKISLATDAYFALKSSKFQGKKSDILLSLHGQHTTKSELSMYKKFVQYFLRKGEKVSYLPMQSKITNDHKIAEYLGIKCHQIDDFQDARRTVKSAKILISSRLHPVFFAIGYSVPFIATSTMSKMENFLADRGLNKYFVQKPTLQNLKNLTEKLLKNSTKISKELDLIYQQEQKKVDLILPSFV